jgi:hypothetical protein
VIRRGFWLALGAAVGITGYRRASRLVQSIRPPAAPPAGAVMLRSPGPLTGRKLLAGAARAGRGAAASAAFVRDVREGVAEYLDQQESGPARTLESQPGRGRPAS